MLGSSFVRTSLAITIAAALSIGFAASVLAQTKPQRKDLGDPAARSFLWVGNSFFYYNNSMHNQVGAFFRAADPKRAIRATSVTISGSGIEWHDMASLLRPDGLGRYSFVGDNEIRFNPPGKQYDAVIMMDCSQCPVHPQLKPIFHDYAKRHATLVLENKMRPAFFMSWAYKDKPEMTAQLANEYTKAGNDNDALVIPAGLAFARAIKERPSIELYVADKRHPSMLGTYLAGATVYATLSGKSPEPLAHTAGIEPELAKFLRRIAWETVQEYFGK